MVAVFCDVTPCRLVDRYQRVGGNCGIRFQNTRISLFYHKGGGYRSLRKIYQTTRHHNPEDCNLNFQRRGNFRVLTLSVSSSARLIRCRGHLFTVPLPSSDRHYLLHHSGFQPSCHKMLDLKFSRQWLWRILAVVGVTPYSLAKVYWYDRGTYRLHL
jgi:hypothetical protein